MSPFNKLFLLFCPALLLCTWIPAEAQNLGVRGGSQSVGGSSPRRSAPRQVSRPAPSVQRSAPVRSAPRRASRSHLRG